MFCFSKQGPNKHACSENGFMTRSLLILSVKYESITMVANWVKTWIKASKPVSLRKFWEYVLFEIGWD